MINDSVTLDNLYTSPEKPRTTFQKAEMGQNFSGELYHSVSTYQTWLVLFCAAFLFGCWLGVPLHIAAMSLSQSDSVNEASAAEAVALRAEGDRLVVHGIMLLETELGADAWEEAANEFQAALQIYRSIGRRDLEASAWQQMGQVYSNLQKNDRALNAYENVIEIAVEIADPQREMRALFGMGRVHQAIGVTYLQLEQIDSGQQSFALANNAYERALLMAKELDEPVLSTRILMNQAPLLVAQDQLEAGLQAYQSAEAVAALLGDDELIAQISAAKGRILRRQGFHAEAIDSMQRALTLYALLQRDDLAENELTGNETVSPTLAEIENMARLHLDSGRSYRELGQWQQSVEQLTAARELIRSLDGMLPRNGNDSGETYTALEISILSLLSSLYQKMGDSANLKKSNDELFALAEADDDYKMQSQLRAQVAENFEAMGATKAALDEYVAALSLLQKENANVPNNLNAAAELLDRIGTLHWQLGNCDESILVYELALTFSRDEAVREAFLEQIGSAYQSLGNYTDSTAAYEKVLTLDSDSTNHSFDGHALLQLGINARRSGESSVSLEIFNEAIQVARSVGDLSTEIDVRVEMGRAYRTLEQPLDALRAFKRALALTERLATAEEATIESAQTYFSPDELAHIEARILREIGRMYLTAGNYDEATQYLEEALAAVEFSAAELASSSLGGSVQSTDTSLLRLRVQILINLAEATAASEDSAGALDYLQEAQLLAAQVSVAPATCTLTDETILIAQIFLEQARLYRAQEQVASAIDAYEDGLDATDDRWLTATILLEVGDVLRRGGRMVDAFARYEEALTLASTVLQPDVLQPDLSQPDVLQPDVLQPDVLQPDVQQWVELSTKVYTRISRMYVELGDYDEAMNVLQQALTTASELGDVAREIRLKLELGSLYKTFADNGVNQGNVDSYEQALALYEDALNLSVLQSDYNGQQDALVKIGQLYTAQSDVNSVLQTQTQLLKLAQAADNSQWEVSALELLGRAYRDSGQYGKAVEPFRQALLLAEELSDRGLEQTMLENMAALYRDLRQPNKAIVAYKQLLDSAILYGDQALERKALENIGKIHRTVGATDDAATAFIRLLQTARTLGDARTERIALVNLANVRADQGRIDDALLLLRQILDTVQLDSTQVGQNQVGQMGIAQAGTGQLQSVARAGLLVADKSPSIETLTLAASTLREMGKLYRYVGQYEEAATHYNESLSLWREISERAVRNIDSAASMPIYAEIQDAQVEEARTLLASGSAHTEVGQYRQALIAYGQALKIFQPTYDIAISSLAFTFTPAQSTSSQSTSSQSTSPSGASMQPAGAKNIDYTITTFTKIAGTYYAMGNYNAAVSVYELGIGMARTEGLLWLEQELLLDLAKTQRKRRNYGAALELYQNALAIQTQSDELTEGQVESSVESAVILNYIGATLNELKRYDQAIMILSEALRTAHEAEEPQLEAKVYVNIGNAYRNSKQYEIALEKYAEALGLYQAIGDQVSESNTLNRMGNVYLSLYQLEKARSSFQHALRIAEEAQDDKLVTDILINLALTYEQSEDLTAATRTYAQAINNLPTMPVSLDAYQEIVALLIEGKRDDDAFRYVQHAQAQTSLHPLGNPWIDYSASLMDPQVLTDTQPATLEQIQQENSTAYVANLIHEEQTIRTHIAGLRQAQSRLQKQLNSVSSGQQNLLLLNRLQNERNRLTNEHETIITELQTSEPRYAAFLGVDTLAIEEVQRELLDEQTTIIQYFILERETVAWVINQNEERLIPLDVTYTELVDRIVQWRQLLESDAECGETSANLSATLAESLFIPLRPYVDTDNVIIIPHSVLNYLPFSALWDAEREEYLVERYAISYVSSVAQLKHAQSTRNADGAQMLALGNPEHQQPLTETELQSVAERYRTTPYTGNRATESELRLNAKTADLLHLALSATLQTEQVLFDTLELRSEGVSISTTTGLQDAHDGMLSLYELYETDLSKTNLVVFSQSGTTVSRQSNGQEIIALQRAVHHAGVPTLLYSLWSVEDEARTQFFDAFYRGLQEQLAPTKALRFAQLAMLDEEKTSAPYYWATFTLAGDHTGAGRSLDTEPIFTPTPIPTPYPTPTPFILPPVWEDEAVSPSDAVAMLDTSR